MELHPFCCIFFKNKNKNKNPKGVYGKINSNAEDFFFFLSNWNNLT